MTVSDNIFVTNSWIIQSDVYVCDAQENLFHITHTFTHTFIMDVFGKTSVLVSGHNMSCSFNCGHNVKITARTLFLEVWCCSPFIPLVGRACS